MSEIVTGLGYESREQLIQQLQSRLAEGLVDVELDRKHYDTAINLAVQRYRARSSGAIEESILFLDLKPDVQEYRLPNEVMEVKRLYRRGVGSGTGSGVNFDPFDVAFNNMYMLQAGQMGGIVLFDAFAQYKELIGRVFGSELDFQWNHRTKVLRIWRKISSEENVAVGIYNFIPESGLLKDVYACDWLASWALAECKHMLGTGRGKFGTLPGPGGSVQLDGEALKAEAVAEKTQLDQDITQMVEGNQPLGFIIG
jgi:hypothetical protein